MGGVFCLVILQNGNRRKLKLATGTYAEFLEKLTAIVDVDLENTLIQMFDSDLDDFVDLAPEDDIPNKAKLRVVSRSTSILCNAAAVAAGRNVIPSQNVAPSCSQDSCAIQPAPIREQGEVVLQACEAAIQEDGSDAMETSQALLIVTRIEDAPCAVLSYRQMSGSDEMQIEDAAISHASMHNNDDYLKFQLPPSFGIWCDTFLQSKQPVTAKVKMHIISHLFKACYRMTPCPTPRLYNKVLDSLRGKVPTCDEREVQQAPLVDRPEEQVQKRTREPHGGFSCYSRSTGKRLDSTFHNLMLTMHAPTLTHSMRRHN
ncbi:hypothetical protein MRX96_021852 [Rhipicephalus microplus]